LKKIFPELEGIKDIPKKVIADLEKMSLMEVTNTSTQFNTEELQKDLENGELLGF
jgi:hypothetical protein